MKMGIVVVIMVDACFRVNVVYLCAVANAYHSLAWASLRIPNCRLLRENT